jgi:hypothetical protein
LVSATCAETEAAAARQLAQLYNDDLDGALGIGGAS